MINKTDCLYADKELLGYQCWLRHKACKSIDWTGPVSEQFRYFRDTGICRFYRESKPCNNDGTVIKEEL